jgi:formiminoglutamase
MKNKIAEPVGVSSWLVVEARERPLIVSMPHTGTYLPPEVAAAVISVELARKDTDWHLQHLYGFVGDLGATVIRTNVSRTVIDVNRDPAGHSLYPGRPTTELCPTTTFDGEPLYKEKSAPTTREIATRRVSYFDPYHAALTSEIARLRAQYDQVLIYDCHSIRSVIPRLFDGVLPILNIGTNSGKSCSPSITSDVEMICKRSSFNFIVDGRFKGGWITRHYGQPDHGVHAVQIEIALRGYMDEGNRSEFNPEKAKTMQDFLSIVISSLLDRMRFPITK